MTSDNRIALGAGAAGVLIAAVLGIALGWPVWVWLAVAALLAGAAWYANHLLADRRKQGRVRELLDLHSAPRPTKQQDSPPGSTTVADLPLASSEPDYPLVFGATVHWRAVHVYLPHADPRGLACDALLQRAWAITVESSPEDHPLMRHRLAAELGAPVTDPSGQLEVWASDVTLAMHATDVQRLNTMAEVRKQEQVLLRERAIERAMRDYLTEDVLTSTGSALVWWLARHPDDVEHAVALIPKLATLTAAAQGRTEPAPDLTEAQRQHLFDELLLVIGDVRRQLDGPHPIPSRADPA